MFNHILSYKTNRVVSGKTFLSDEIAGQELHKAFQEIHKKDEKDNYVEFPLEYFKGKDFDFQLDQTGFLVLRTWGLENRACFPNFPAIRDFLNHRFNYGMDDIKELSPL